MASNPNNPHLISFQIPDGVPKAGIFRAKWMKAAESVLFAAQKSQEGTEEIMQQDTFVPMVGLLGPIVESRVHCEKCKQFVSVSSVYLSPHCYCQNCSFCLLQWFKEVNQTCPTCARPIRDEELMNIRFPNNRE